MTLAGHKDIRILPNLPTDKKTLLDSLHTSKRNNLCSRVNSKETLQNLIYLIKWKPIKSNFNFFSYEFPDLCYQRPGYSLKWKSGSCLRWKTKKTMWVFFLLKYSKFWSIPLEFNLERKLFVLEVCLLAPSSFYDIHSVGQNDIKAPKNAFYYFLFCFSLQWRGTWSQQWTGSIGKHKP